MKENQERFDPNPHTRYFEEQTHRRRGGGRISFVFILFGLSVSALMILAVIMVMNVVTSITG